MLYAFLRVLLWGFTRLICRYRVIGLERVPLNGPLLIVANHLSFYDPLLLGVALPRRIWFFTKSEIFRWPIAGLACKLTGQIPVRRGESDRIALEKALGYLREDKALMLFPEGTVERKETMIPARAGAAMLTSRTGVTVLPIAHAGTRRVLRSPRYWFPRVTITIGEPYVPVILENVPRKVALQHVTNDIMSRIAEMLPPENRGVYGEIALSANLEG
jgi:1-acyl-sn-glycerol-3-phosphate acyltransferase